MKQKFIYRFASFLFKNCYPLYSLIYHFFKLQKDADELMVLKNEIKQGDILLDIGSNIGFYAVILSKQVGNTGKVHCFEPDKTNFEHLKKSVCNLKNVILNNVAVTDNNGQIEMFISHRLNVDHRTYKPEKYDLSYFVNAITIDQYLGTSSKVDFIKIDIQGAELSALKGMVNTLNRNDSIKILIEIWPHGLCSAGTSVKEIFSLMFNLGFKAFKFEKNKVLQLQIDNLPNLIKGEYNYYNVIFKR